MSKRMTEEELSIIEARYANRIRNGRPVLHPFDNGDQVRDIVLRLLPEVRALRGELAQARALEHEIVRDLDKWADEMRPDPNAELFDHASMLEALTIKKCAARIREKYGRGE